MKGRGAPASVTRLKPMQREWPSRTISRSRPSRPISAGLAPDLTGRHVLISAGGTREELDPVRFLGNWSSGRQGYALAEVAAMGLAPRSTLVRRSTLEDVFLRLTGRTLVD